MIIRHRIYKIIVIFSIFLLFKANLVFSYEEKDGVLISGGGYTPSLDQIQTKSKPVQKNISSDVQSLIDTYVQQVVINTVLQKVSDIMRTTLQSQQIHIMPQVLYSAVQQASLEIFKQSEMSKITRQAYDESRNYAIDAQKKGASQSSVQSEIKNKIDKIIGPINDEMIFRRIVDYYMKQAVNQNKRIIMQTVGQREAQLLAIEKRQAIMQAALKEKYMQAIQQGMQKKYIQAIQQGMRFKR